MSIVADLISLVGLVMLGYGLWLISPALSLSIIGGLLIVFGVSLGRAQSNMPIQPPPHPR
jgi:hypothetical protein